MVCWKAMIARRGLQPQSENDSFQQVFFYFDSKILATILLNLLMLYLIGDDLIPTNFRLPPGFQSFLPTTYNYKDGDYAVSKGRNDSDL